MFSKLEICFLKTAFFWKASSASWGIAIFKIFKYFTSLSNCKRPGSKLTLSNKWSPVCFLRRMKSFCFSVESFLALSSHSVLLPVP